MTLRGKLFLTLLACVPLWGLVIICDMIGAHLFGYGRQQVEIVSIEYTGYSKAPYRLNYRTADGRIDHMGWPAFKEGADRCKPGMVIEAIVSLSVGTPIVETCRYRAAEVQTP